MAAPRPNSTPAQPGLDRAHTYMPQAIRATAHMSQLMVPARIMPGATATISPSDQRRPAIRTVSTATTAQRHTTNTALTSQNARVSLPPSGTHWVICAATEATRLMSTGYSKVEPAANGAQASSANPRPP